MSPAEKGPRKPNGSPSDSDADTPSGALSRLPRGKRPWQPPRVRTGHLFESNSLACGKSTPQLEQCTQNPVTS